MKTKRHFYLSLTIGLLALVFYFPTSVQAQKKGSKKEECEISDKVDEFTKVRNIVSGPKTFYSEFINIT